MDSFIKRLDESRASAWEQMKSIVERAEAEGRDLTAEESETWDKHDAEIIGIDARKRQLTEAEARAKAADALRVEHAAVIAPKAEAKSDYDQLRALLRGEVRSVDFGPSESRTLTTPGGSAIPTDFYSSVIAYQRSLNPILAYATVLNTSDGSPITFPRLTADPNTGGTVTLELGTISSADPTISSVNLGAFKYASLSAWSRELDEDNVIGLSDLVARHIARDLSFSYGAHLTTGTGTTQPYGIVTRAANGGTANGTAGNTANDTFFGPTDLIDLYFGRAIPYRQSGTWLLSTTAMSKVRKMRDSSNQFVFQIGVGVPDTILGRPAVEQPQMAAVASASKSVLFGDVSRYFVRMTPMRVETSTEYAFSTDSLTLKTVIRLDADLIDTAAVAYLVSANT